MYVIGGLVAVVAVNPIVYVGFNFFIGSTLGALLGFGIELEIPYSVKSADPPRLLHRADEPALRERDRKTLEQRVLYTL